RIKTQGPDQADLDKFKKTWHQGHQRALRENGYWVAGLEGAVMDGTDPARLLTITDEVDALSVADVQKAAQRYFDMNNYVEVVLKPEVLAPTKVASAGQ
ncbi:MAG TPA: insulinase family protein, partial [Telluria sp.]